jgi:ubiquinone/menaquinone biosynthesis C-methylase UbiE
MPNFNNGSELKKQYGTANNLNTRVLLHQQFSTNKLGWSNWVFQNPKQAILEIGCGNGGIWKSNTDKVPHDVKLILSDFSDGMLNAAKENTKGMDFIEYKVIDARYIPYSDNTFDMVIANHMLYHVPEIKKALSEISRVIKPNGIFYATTIGENNIKELVEILHDFDPNIDFAQGSITEAFGLENGKKNLSEFFNSVELRRYEDSLHITEPQPLIDYVLSSKGIGNINDIIVGEKVKQFSSYISKLFSENGYIDVSKDAGMFISSNPTK